MEKAVHPVRKRRWEQGYTQEELAERAEIGARTVVRIELGDSQPRRTTLAALARALNTVPAALEG